MKILLSCFLVLTLGACANNRPAQQTLKVEQAAQQSETAYGGKCGMGLCLKKDVKGDEKYSVDYKGRHYIFSSPAARDNFLSKLDENIKKADAHYIELNKK